MKIELNIRLDSRYHRRSLAECDRRATGVIAALCHAFDKVHARRHTAQVEGRDGELHLEDMIIAGVECLPAQIPTYRDALAALAQDMEQDCVAVYRPGSDKGELIGPRPEAWAPFDHDAFVRY